MKRILHTLALAGAVVAGHADAQPLFEGFLCCNLRSDGSWISEINYVWPGARLFPVGTPVKVSGYGRQRVFLDIEGGKQALGNDYSRDLALDVFAERYILKDDPRPRIAAFPEKIRRAIASGMLTSGMTREQVMMSVGRPVTSENPDPNARTWRFWLNMEDEFQVAFDDAGLVSDVSATAKVRKLVVLP